MTNVVVLLGRLTRPAELRLLPSGDQLVGLEVSIPRPGERAETAPVVWHDPPAAASELDVDDEVVVVGRVRRRFFRTAGGTQSRTEVVAEVVVPTGEARAARAAVAAVVAHLAPLGAASAPSAAARNRSGKRSSRQGAPAQRRGAAGGGP